MSKSWLVLGGFGLALVVTPYLACSNSNDAELTYSEADLKAAVLGTWQGSADIDGETVEFSLVLEQASAKSKTHSQLLLNGTLTSVNPALNGAVDGEVYAGKDVGPADLSLRLEDGKQFAGVLEKQALSDGRITSKVQLGTFSLSRP